VTITKVLDIFSGAGGIAQGFKAEGFSVLGADISEYAGRTFELNSFGTFRKTDLAQEIIEGDFDVIVGGPPCKPWSAVNTTRRGKDHRDFVLLSKFFEHIKVNRPSLFVLENVPLIAGEPTLSKLINKASRDGYSIEGRILRYSDFGAPTNRRRFFLFGSRIGQSATFFQSLENQKKSYKTVKQAIWSLRTKERNNPPDHVWPNLKTIDNYVDKYKTNKFGWYILEWDKPAPSFGNIMKTYILHPDAFSGGTKRVISVKETSLIMGFDNNFRFPDKGFLGCKYQLIVDSVSPVFSKILANVIKHQLRGEKPA
jgi:DNA (cytosine-5)-methyltransferase 1